MNKQNDTEVFTQIDDLLARLRKEITEPMKDRPDLVEEGINLFYKKAGKKPPLILWCDSPLQTMLIPTMVSNILRSATWKTLVENMADVKSSNTSQYASKFKSEWIKVEKNLILPGLEKIWNFQ